MSEKNKHPFLHPLWVSLSAAQKQELSEKSGMSIPYLSHLANGVRKPGIETLVRLQFWDASITAAQLRPDLYEGRPA